MQPDKAALLKVLAGRHKVRVGKLSLDGEVLSAKSPRWQQDVQYVEADPGSLASGNVWAKLQRELRSERRGRSKVPPVERAEQILRDLELFDKCSGMSATLSDAERWRLSIARGLFSEPRCLLLEEVPEALEVEEVVQTLALLRPRVKAGVTVFFATSREMSSVGFDRLVLIDEGRMLAVGAPAALAENYNVPPQIQLSRREATEVFVEETMEEGFIWMDTEAGNFISALPDELAMEDFYQLLDQHGLPRSEATLAPPLLSELFQAVAGRALEE